MELSLLKWNVFLTINQWLQTSTHTKLSLTKNKMDNDKDFLYNNSTLHT